MTRAELAELARLVYLRPNEAYGRLIAASRKPLDGYTCSRCGAEIDGDLGRLVEHGNTEHAGNGTLGFVTKPKGG